MKVSMVGVIGCGNMGGAIVRGITGTGMVSADTILLNDYDAEKAGRLACETGCVRTELSALVEASDILVIAVKPQDSEALLENISVKIQDQTIVSIMAGVKIRHITAKLGKCVPVVRAMPNMAAFVGESVTGMACNDMVKIKEDIKVIFNAIGKVVEVEEDALDTVTAVSGSGPAYLFYLADAMICAAREAGFDEKTANELVVQTLYGSALLLKEGPDSPGELVKKVASKGGTTEAALSVFNEEGLKNIIKIAVLRAKERSKELSGG